MFVELKTAAGQYLAARIFAVELSVTALSEEACTEHISLQAIDCIIRA